MSADTSSASVAGNPGGDFPRAFLPDHTRDRPLHRRNRKTHRHVDVVSGGDDLLRGRHALRVRRADRLGLRIQLHGQWRGLHARMPDMRCCKGAHVRTDIYWENYSERKKGIVDLISYLLFFYPAMITFMLISIDDTWHSYETGERSQESVWRAIMWPFRATIPLAALLSHDPGLLRGPEVLVPGPYRARARAQGKDRDMTGLELLGLVMLLVMLGAIFIGLPICFTLLFLALIVRLLRHGRARFSTSPTCRPSA